MINISFVLEFKNYKFISIEGRGYLITFKYFIVAMRYALKYVSMIIDLFLSFEFCKSF